MWIDMWTIKNNKNCDKWCLLSSEMSARCKSVAYPKSTDNQEIILCGSGSHFTDENMKI